MHRPEHSVRLVSRIHGFKKRQGSAFGTKCHVGAHLSRAQMGTVVHLTPDKLQTLFDWLASR